MAFRFDFCRGLFTILGRCPRLGKENWKLWRQLDWTRFARTLVMNEIWIYRLPSQSWTADIFKEIFSPSIRHIEWSLHNPKENVYDFSGMADLIKFIDLAAKHSLLVILKPGPYIGADRDFGGHPVSKILFHWALFEIYFFLYKISTGFCTSTPTFNWDHPMKVAY